MDSNCSHKWDVIKRELTDGIVTETWRCETCQVTKPVIGANFDAGNYGEYPDTDEM